MAETDPATPTSAPALRPSARRRLGREDVRRIHLRHRGYRLLLVSIGVMLLIQPLTNRWPLLSPLSAIGIALMMLLFLTRYSLLKSRLRLINGLGIAAIGSELLWLLILVSKTSLTLHLSILHLLVWFLFIGTFLIRMARVLMLEPYVTLAVLLGAAAGYLLIGYLGAFLLHTLLLFRPEAFELSLVSPGFDPSLHPMRAFPAMVVASLQSLTTSGTEVIRPGDLLSSTGGLVITVAGQLYVAVLIALILGRFHHRPRS